MIDTKIACQCGNRFKFGMDLVNGRAPDGLVCPTCGAAATPACNALVDFLSGKDPAPPGTGSRPVKEVRVTCTCGARYKFDLELAEMEMPAPVQCPGCQIDLTPLANQEIRNYRTKHAIDPAGSPAAAPAPASVATTAPEPATLPPSAASATAPPPAASDSAPNSSAQATPPPAEAKSAAPPAAPAAAPTPAAAPAAPASTPVVDPFGPAPTGKSSGPNLRPLEAPKITRPPPGSPPAKPATLGSPGSSQKSAKPDSSKPPAKPVAKPAAAPAAARREPNLALGVAGAVIGAVIGAALWFVVLKSTAMSGGFMAPVVGTLAGFGARLLGRGASQTLGGAACISAVLGIGVMAWLAMSEYVNRQMRPQIKGQYDRAVADAKEAAGAKTDEELKRIVARGSMNVDTDGSRVTEAELKVFRTTRLPKMLDLATGKMTRERYEAELLAGVRANADWMDVWQDSLGMLGLLWLIAGAGAAARIALR